MSIGFDYFSISLLIGGLTALLSGFVVFIHNRVRLENIAWLLSNVTSAIWSFGYFATITARTHSFAIMSDLVLHFAAVLIPVFYLFSVLSITEEYENHKIQLVITEIIAFLFLLVVPFRSFIKDVIPKAHFNFVPDAGPLYIYFTVFFFAVVFYTLYFVFRKLKNTTDPIMRARLKYIIIFTIFGFGGGGSVFFLTFNVHILPYPLILFSLYPAVSGYAIFRYQLFNVRVITTEILVFLLWIFLLVRTLLSVTLIEGMVNGALLLLVVITGILLIRSVIKEVKLAQDLKVANEGQANLIHIMNHQVKGRLGNAKNIFAELLTDDYGHVPDDFRPWLEKGLEETSKGVDYVQGILRGASAESGTLPFDMRQIDLKNVAEEAFGRLKDYAEKKGLAVNLNTNPGDYKITGDAVELGEAIRNLIDNSINYTEKGSINVALSQAEKTLLLQVKDTGVGITAEDKSKLFKSGGRGADSLKVNVNSTGYGLAFVKGVVDAHNGKVWVESEGKGKGSTFYMELPRV